MCPNPACGIEMPLVRSWWLSKKAAKEAYVVAFLVADESITSGQRFLPSIELRGVYRPALDVTATMALRPQERASRVAESLQAITRAQARTVGLGSQLMAVVAEGQRQGSI